MFLITYNRVLHKLKQAIKILINQKYLNIQLLYFKVICYNTMFHM